MKLPSFFSLKQAIANLDVNFIANKISELETNLTGRGHILEPENTAFTEEGIYYINPESGMTTKVMLYNSDQQMTFASPPRSSYSEEGYDEPELIQRFNRYHIVRCNLLMDEKLRGWNNSHRLTQRQDGTFYYRFIEDSPGKSPKLIKEIERQKLSVCPNCYFKVTSLIEGVGKLSQESFSPRYFFDVESAGSWCRYDRRSDDVRFLADIYPKDWADICRKRMRQVHFHCESCNRNFSDPQAHRFLTVHHTDHVKRKIAYVRLECLCIGCMSDQPSGIRLKNHPTYREYQRFIAGLDSSQTSTRVTGTEPRL